MMDNPHERVTKTTLAMPRPLEFSAGEHCVVVTHPQGMFRPLRVDLPDGLGMNIKGRWIYGSVAVKMPTLEVGEMFVIEVKNTTDAPVTGRIVVHGRTIGLPGIPIIGELSVSGGWRV